MPDSAVSWTDFLANAGALRVPEASPDAVTFPMPEEPGTGFLCALTHLGVIAAAGDDAQSFLHSQLTNDVLGLDGSHARLAGYCSAKGRLLATLLLWKSGDEIMLALPRELLAATLKRLQMFVLRSKVKLRDASDEYALLGVAAPGGAIAGIPSQTWQLGTLGGGTLVRMPDAGGLQRALWVGTVSHAMPQWTTWSAQLKAAPSSVWRWTEILAGQPQVLEATREQFVPQMINFELVGGVNFRKGCYPGQEVVARSQYLGKLKRRTLLAFVDDMAVAAGTEVFSEADPGQPSGRVVNAERGPDGRIACLVEMKLAAADSTARLRSADGPALSFGQLPYDLGETA